MHRELGVRERRHLEHVAHELAGEADAAGADDGDPHACLLWTL